MDAKIRSRILWEGWQDVARVYPGKERGCLLTPRSRDVLERAMIGHVNGLQLNSTSLP